jgi:sucrose-6-phosphate hydrolase SacC (GH32 family)
MNGGRYPGMPFNQQMSFPTEMKLRTFPEGPRICRLPVKEIQKLHGKQYSWRNKMLAPGENPLAGITGELFDVRAEIELSSSAEVGFKLRGEPVSYSVKDQKLGCLGKSAPLDPINGRLTIQILVDRTSLEVFANEGRVAMTSCFLPAQKNRSLEIFATGGPAKIISLRVFELHSACRSASPVGAR